MQTLIWVVFLYFFAAFPKKMAQGKATIWVTRRASKSPWVSSPMALPEAVAISMMVYTPSI